MRAVNSPIQSTKDPSAMFRRIHAARMAELGREIGFGLEMARSGEIASGAE
jgi:hypothetical protein